MTREWCPLGAASSTAPNGVFWVCGRPSLDDLRHDAARGIGPVTPKA